MFNGAIRFTTVASVLFLAVPLGAMAQTVSEQPKIEISKPRLKPTKTDKSQPASSGRERKSGELEGWSPSGGKLKENTSAASKSRGPKEDGGLPLPENKARGGIESGLSFGKDGNMTTGVKF